jgi:collagen type III alpha
MATVFNQPPASSPLDVRLEQELGRATGRIRLNDLLTGGLSLVVLTFGYAAAAVLLDRWLELPEWVRQVMFGGFLLVFAGVGYLMLLRPLQRRVNPRFAARKVEATVPDAKNALINWVDLRDRELPEGVRVAVRAKAAEGVAEANVDKAVESRRVVWLAAVAGLLLAVLATLFVIFKPAPFLSLVSRTFNPFTVTRIATRTELTIQEPEGGDATVTAGDPVTVRVYVGGSIPDPDGPGRVRLRVRYNPAVPEYDELPLEPGGSAREWMLRVPQAVVQNGFWYTVAGGDAETPEHRVTVRSRPLFKFDEFEARYEYPAYTRLKPEVGHEPALWAYPGTQVTITAKTNRRVKRGWMQMSGQPDPIPGLVIGEGRDALQFKLTMPHESGTYRLGFTSADDEPSEPTPAYPIKVETDKKPWVRITAPAEDEVTLPANGLLQVDGTLEDDFGLASAALGMRLVDGNLKVDLPPKPYRDGKAFRRESDGTFPTKMDYKDSVPLGSLTYKDGQRATLKENMTLEYWLEATDNCTEPKPNVGKSAVKRVRIAPPAKEPEKQQQQQQAQQQRAAEEQQHRQQQDQQLQTEKRDPPPQLRPEEKPNPDEQKQNGGEGAKSPEQGDQQPKPNEKQEPKGGNAGENPPKPSDPQKGVTEPPGKPNEPPSKPETGSTPPNTAEKPPASEKGGTPEPMADTNPPPKPGDAQQGPKATQQPSGAEPAQDDPKKAEQKAQEVQNAIEQQHRQPGDARSQDPDAAKPAEAPADKKPAGQPQSGAPAEPKAGQPTDPQGQPMGSPSAESKPAGNLEQPKPTDPKPEPKPADVNSQQPNQQGSAGGEATGGTPKRSATVGGNEPAQEKPQPGAQGSEPTQPKEPTAGEKKPGDMQPTDPGAARSPGTTLQSKPSAGEPAKGQPAAESKPKPEASRGQERPTEGTGVGQQSPEDRPADSKGAKPVDPAARKQPPAGGAPNQAPPAGEKPQPGAASTDPMDPRKSPAAAKPEGSKPQPGSTATDPTNPPQAGQPQPDEKATEKSAQPQGTEGQKEPKNAQGSGRERSKVDPKEIEQAARDLSSDDPQRQQAARDKLDKLMGKGAREQAEREAKQLAEDLKSADPAKRQAAEQKLKDLAKQAGQQDGSGQGEKKVDPKELEQAARDLASGDPQKQQAARDKLDRMVGKEARERAEREAKQLADDLKSADPEKRNAAEQKLKDLAKQAERQGGGQGETKVDPKEIEQAVKDLGSDDPNKKQAARDKLDRAFGKDARQQAEQIADDLKSGDPSREQAARKKLEDLAKQAGGQPNKDTAHGQPSKEDVERWSQKARDLASDDKAKREAAEREFDQAVGKERRQDLQQQMKDLKAGDPKARQAAEERAKEAVRQAAQRDADHRQYSDNLRQMVDKARDLTSDDPAKRRAAEELFDKTVGKDNREQLQKDLRDPQKREEARRTLDALDLVARMQDLQDMKSDDPQKAEAARKRMAEWAKNRPPPGPPLPKPKDFRVGGEGSRGQEGSLHQDDPRNRLKTAELQLKSFEENRHNKELQNKLGWTQEEYDRFLAEQQKRVAQMRDEVARQERQGVEPQPTGPPTLRVGEGSGNRKLETRSDGTTTTSGGAGPGTAPAGYSEAQRRFAEEAAKLRKGQDKK